MNDFQRIEAVIRFLEQHRSEQPSLDRLADHVGLSRFHFQRLFSRWAGITPKAFLKVLNLAHAKKLLSEGRSVLDCSLETGLSGPGRLHDLCVTLESASPGEMKSGGSGWVITCGFASTPFGTCLVGENHRGICHLSFEAAISKEVAEEAIRLGWPNAAIQWSDHRAGCISESIFRAGNGPRPTLKAFVRGTEFQVRVWRALLEIPEGELTSYSRLASSLGKPSAARAVASAVAKNSLAYVIPCHRVIRETGVVGDYRWGRHRKIAMMAWEQSRSTASTHRLRRHGIPNE